MWVLKSDFKKLVTRYNTYFHLQKEEIKDYVQLKQKVIQQLKRKSKKELENLKIELIIKTSKKGTNWDNFTATRLSFIAIIISVIGVVRQYFPDSIEHTEIYLRILLFFGAIYLFSFTYKDEKNEDERIFLKFVLDCLNEISENKK